MEDFYEIDHLVKLFNPPREDDDDDEDYTQVDRCAATPANLHSTNTKSEKVNPYAKIEPEKKENEEFDENRQFSDFGSEHSTDWKKTPKYDISYRQKVTSSDVFLQMDAKTPATASCEDMIVTVDLPGEHMQNMDIRIKPKSLEVDSPNYFLNLPLPQPVHPQKGNAKWHKDEGKLIITLTMEREFDFINF